VQVCTKTSPVVSLRPARPAKSDVIKHLGAWFGWKPENVIDLGDITGARGTEMFLPLWLRLFQKVVGNPHFNIYVIRGR
jgi:hypothetical protein